MAALKGADFNHANNGGSEGYGLQTCQQWRLRRVRASARTFTPSKPAGASAPRQGPLD